MNQVQFGGNYLCDLRAVDQASKAFKKQIGKVAIYRTEREHLQLALDGTLNALRKCGISVQRENVNGGDVFELSTGKPGLDSTPQEERIVETLLHRLQKAHPRFSFARQDAKLSPPITGKTLKELPPDEQALFESLEKAFGDDLPALPDDFKIPEVFDPADWGTGSATSQR